MMLEKMVLRPTCINNLGTVTFLPSVFFTWSVSLAFGDTMTWGWLLKALTKNNWVASSILKYPFLHLERAQKMPTLPVDSCRRFEEMRP